MQFSPIDTIMLVRLGVLPPYCYDEDEDERDEEDYRSFLIPRLDECLSAVCEYIKAWKDFMADTASRNSFDHLLRARQSFIASLPFTYDELVTETDYYDEAVEYAWGIYKQMAAKGRLTRNLEKYRNALEQLKE